jgi:hypothetical protein
MPNAGYQLEFAACTNNVEAAKASAKNLGGSLYVDGREPFEHLPFRALLTCTTDDIADLAEVSERGLYVVCRRIIKPGVPKVVSVSPMVHHPDKTAQACDAHWRDNHAPLALIHHEHMTHYSQLSVVNVISGPDLTGIALCGFATESDLRDRFFSRPDSVPVILADIKKFSDAKKSPKRLVAQVI